MAQCPICSSSISYTTLCKHSIFTPIKCPSCGARLHFETRSWIKISVPMAILFLAWPIISLCGLDASWVAPVLLIPMCVMLIKFMIDVPRVKLKAKSSDTKILVNLPNHWACGSEVFWAEPCGNDLYKIVNVPFFAYGLNFKDVVQAIKPDDSDYPEVIEVVEPSGNKTIRFTFEKGTSEETHSEVINTLEKLGISGEGSTAGSYAMNIPPSIVFKEVFDLFEHWADVDGLLFFETTEERVPRSFDDVPDDDDDSE